MTKYLICIIIGFFGFFYEILFRDGHSLFNLGHHAGASLIVLSAILYLNLKNKIAAILSILGLLSFSKEIFLGTQYLFNTNIPDSIFSMLVTINSLSNLVLITGLLISISVLVSKNNSVFELQAFAKNRKSTIILTYSTLIVLPSYLYFAYTNWN